MLYLNKCGNKIATATTTITATVSMNPAALMMSKRHGAVLLRCSFTLVRFLCCSLIPFTTIAAVLRTCECCCLVDIVYFPLTHTYLLLLFVFTFAHLLRPLTRNHIYSIFLVICNVFPHTKLKCNDK